MRQRSIQAAEDYESTVASLKEDLEAYLDVLRTNSQVLVILRCSSSYARLRSISTKKTPGFQCVLNMEVTKKIAQKIIDASKMLKSRADDNAFDSSDVCVIDGICKALNAYAYDLINRAKVQTCFSNYHTLFKVEGRVQLG